MNTTLRLLLYGALLAPLTTSCADEAPVAQSEAQHLTLETGYHHLGLDDDDVYRDLATDGDLAYLARGPRGIHVIDLASMSVVEEWTHLASGEQLHVDGVQILDGQVITWGQRDDAELDWDPAFARSFVIQALSADGEQLEWSVTLDLRDAIVDENSPFVQLPNMHAYVAAGRIVVSFGHLDEPDRLLAFDVPDGEASYDLLDIPGVQILDHVDNPKGIVSTENGYLLVNGPDGLSRVTESGSEVLNADLGYAVDLRSADGLAYVADHQGYLHVVASASGQLVDSLEIPDWVEGIDIVEGYVLVGAREGIFIAKGGWDIPDEPIDDGPVDEDPVGEDPGDEDGGDEDGGGGGICTPWSWWNCF